MSMFEIWINKKGDLSLESGSVILEFQQSLKWFLLKCMSVVVSIINSDLIFI